MQCMTAGMDDYLAKPYSRNQLQQVLTRWLTLETGADEEKIKASTTEPETSTKTPSSTALNLKCIDQLRELDPSGGITLIRQILQAYLDSSFNAMTEITQAINHRDAETVRRAAHSMKSSSANVGADNLSSLFKQLEDLCKQEKLEQASKTFDEIRQEYTQAVTEIRVLLAEDA
jgi:HPt (histidine-containing phosphotransfer) domain-containing protein